MANTVDWKGHQVPPSVKMALEAPWRGQENLKGPTAKKVLEFFTDTGKFCNVMDVVLRQTSPTKLTCKTNVKTVMRLKATGDKGKAYEYSFGAINSTKLVTIMLACTLIKDETKAAFCSGMAAKAAKDWLAEYNEKTGKDLVAAPASAIEYYFGCLGGRFSRI
jgi:hypothetical protein